jgi:ribonuclease HII
VDEAGRGPLAGPVVASAVIVRDFSFSCEIDDSKRMTPETRELAYREILQKAAVGVSVVGHEVIDELNILWASMRAMAEAVGRLGEAPGCVLVDGNREPEVPFPRFAIVAGDATSFSIACASVVAKVTRDRLMLELDGRYPGYGFARHKGYGTREHLEALKAKGPCEIHRRSFEPVKSILAGVEIDMQEAVRGVNEEDL